MNFSEAGGPHSELQHHFDLKIFFRMGREFGCPRQNALADAHPDGPADPRSLRFSTQTEHRGTHPTPDKVPRRKRRHNNKTRELFQSSDRRLGGETSLTSMSTMRSAAWPSQNWGMRPVLPFPARTSLAATTILAGSVPTSRFVP